MINQPHFLQKISGFYQMELHPDYRKGLYEFRSNKYCLSRLFPVEAAVDTLKENNILIHSLFRNCYFQEDIPI